MRPSVRTDYDVEMKTRDGVILRADVMRPMTSEPVPVVLSRTPYDKSQPPTTNAFFDPLKAAAAGFAVVVQDIRGRFASDGEWGLSGMHEIEAVDGQDCVDWLASEPWCDGNVGMFGGSYVGQTQLAAAVAHPPALKAITPALLGNGGTRAHAQASQLESVLSTFAVVLSMSLRQKVEDGTADPADVALVAKAMQDPAAVASTLPLAKILQLATPGLPQFGELMSLAHRGGLQAELDSITIPALWLGGLFDPLAGAEAFLQMRTSGASEAARDQSMLVLGPWSHTSFLPFIGEVATGMAGTPGMAGIHELYMGFFARHLRGEAVDLPRVTHFVMGANQWEHASDWPPPGTIVRRMFLHSHGSANSSAGDGRLDWEQESSGEFVDRYDYDPSHPVPSWGFRVLHTGGSTLAGPFNQARVETRPDVLVYTSAPLEKALKIVGDVEAQLHFSTSAPDTDIVVKLCQVDPAGVSRNLADGFLRLRWRAGTAEPQFATPGEVLDLTVKLGPVSQMLPPGHQLRLQVTSSAFPHYSRSLNTIEPVETAVEPVVAHQAIHHGGQFRSHVSIPTQTA